MKLTRRLLAYLSIVGTVGTKLARKLVAYLSIVGTGEKASQETVSLT